MKRRTVVPFLVSVICLTYATGLRAQSAAVQEFRKGEVVVELRPGASIDAVNARIKTTTLKNLYGTNFYLLATPKQKKEVKFRKKLAKDPDVLSAALNPVVSNPALFGRSTMSFPDGFATPGKTHEEFINQTQLFTLLKLEQAHARSTGRGIIIAVIDTGLDYQHSMLSAHVWQDSRPNADIPNDGIDNDNDGLIDDYRGWDFVDNDNDPRELPDDPNKTVAGHGTFIAGIISKIAPDAVIMPIRAFPVSGVADEFTVASAIKYAADQGAKIINLSFGMPEFSSLLDDAIRYAKERGSILIAAAGNENSEAPQFPASALDVLAVSAIDLNSQRAHFSNFGEYVDVSAPGVKLISAYPGAEGGYAQWSGTSFAAPFAAGEAALIAALDTNIPDIKKTIEDAAINIDAQNPGFSGKLGKGRLDLLKPLECLNTDCAPPVRSLFAETSLLRVASVQGEGKAEIQIVGSKQEFEIEVRGIAPRQLYQLFVNNVLLRDNIVSTGLGGIKLEFSTDDGSLPTAFNPVTKIRRVELRLASSGLVILGGDFGSPIATPTDQKTEKEARLFSALAGSQSGGKARVHVEAERQSLSVEAERLQIGNTYVIFADGMNLGMITDVTRTGFVKAIFTSDGSSGRFLPATLLPAINISHIQIFDLSGSLILQGTFQPGGSEIGDDDPEDDGGGGGGGGGGQEIDREVNFMPTGADPDASGKVRIRVRGQREDLKIEAEDIESSRLYFIIIDGFSMGDFRANDKGEIEVEWSTATEPGKLALPAFIRPITNIQHIEIRNAVGTTVLSVTLTP